jgi:hypothetical protein
MTYLDDKPYLIDAIAGNSRFLASLDRTGRMYRLGGRTSIIRSTSIRSAAGCS